jgi:hypothetical protein
MTNHLTYLAARAHIDDLLREATDRQRIERATVPPRASLPQRLRQPRRGLRQPRQVGWPAETDQLHVVSRS